MDARKQQRQARVGDRSQGHAMAFLMGRSMESYRIGRPRASNSHFHKKATTCLSIQPGEDINNQWRYMKQFYGVLALHETQKQPYCGASTRYNRQTGGMA
jgi:hypothetical protein